MIKKHYFRTWNLAKVWATLRQVGTPGFFSGLLSDLNMPEKTELKEIGGAVLSFALSNLFHWLMNVISLYIQQYASALVFVYLSKLSQCITNDACFFLVLIHRHDNNRLSKKWRFCSSLKLSECIQSRSIFRSGRPGMFSVATLTRKQWSRFRWLWLFCCKTAVTRVSFFNSVPTTFWHSFQSW